MKWIIQKFDSKAVLIEVEVEEWIMTAYTAQSHLQFNQQPTTTTSVKSATEVDFQEQCKQVNIYTGSDKTFLRRNDNLFQQLYSSVQTKEAKKWLINNFYSRLIYKYLEFKQTCHFKLKATLLKGEVAPGAIKQAKLHKGLGPLEIFAY